jgi:ribosomal protein S18 acetylase RimI-like enzyme
MATALSHLLLPVFTTAASWEIKRAAPRDAGAIARIVRTAFRGPFSLRDGPLIATQALAMEAQLRMQIAARLERPGERKEAILVAADNGDGEVIGCADVRISCFEHATGTHHAVVPPAALQEPEGFALRPYLSNLAVAPRARRRGLARALVQRCEDEALGWGFADLSLEVVATNEPALALYRELGYMLTPCDDEVLVAVRRKFWFGEEWTPKLRLVKALGDAELDAPSRPSAAEGTDRLGVEALATAAGAADAPARGKSDLDDGVGMLGGLM